MNRNFYSSQEARGERAVVPRFIIVEARMGLRNFSESFSGEKKFKMLIATNALISRLYV
jgi:hypothetical protein